MCPLTVHPVQSCGRLLQLGDAQLQGINVTEGPPHPLLLVDHDSTESSSGRSRPAARKKFSLVVVVKLFQKSCIPTILNHFLAGQEKRSLVVPLILSS